MFYVTIKKKCYNLWCHEVVSNAARLWTEIYWGQHPDDTLKSML